MPELSTAALNLDLAEIDAALPAGIHAVMSTDRDGWHISEGKSVPANLTLDDQPPYSPELSAFERVWLYLRER